MRKVITIALSEPVATTARLVECLRRCHGIEAYTIVVHVDVGCEKSAEAIRNIGVGHVVSKVNDTVLGAPRTICDALRHGFSLSDFVIHIHPGTLPAPDTLTLMEFCESKYRAEKEVLSVSAYCESDPTEKVEELARRCLFDDRLFGVWREKWDASAEKTLEGGLHWHAALKNQWQVYPLKSRCLLDYGMATEQLTSGFKEQPRVTAVLITGLNPKRHHLACVAVQCFLAQTHRNKELLIINHGEHDFQFCDPNIREIRVEKRPDQTIGDLRNCALEYAHGSFIINWDDDDWHSPERIAVQMAAQTDDAIVLLKRQIRYNFLNDSAFCECVPKGISGTILHRANPSHRYPSLVKGSDTTFMLGFRDRVVVDNPGTLYVRFFHGMNLWSAGHVMHHLAKEATRGRRELTVEDNARLNEVLAQYQAFQFELVGIARSH